ncbi:MAG: LPS export ABC transporter ATP-binding protein [Synergistaceae bacterium]|jgi:lipopolysaccharide export system ATP-binding protein|nr:LPS export ABC transporter ATP-binding protein [Synergistaceae bacterium]
MADSGRSVLSGTALSKSFKRREVVSGVSVSVGAGEVVGLLGPNGAGKSTTFYMMTGRIMPDSGKVFIGDEDVTRLPMYMRARKGVGYLPQEPSIFRRISVGENLDLVLASSGVGESERAQRSAALALEFGLGRVMEAPGYALSGGERRRVEIARCLAANPAFILLDEPFSGIDPVAVCDLQDIIRSLRAKGFGILLTDHNVRETLAITDRTYIMHQGKVVVSGPPDKIANDPLAKKYYLGDRFEW